MVDGLLGKKLGKTQIFREDGTRVPVTVIEAGPCDILQVKTPERDGYFAVQLGFDGMKEKRATKPRIGHAKKAGTGPKRFIREVAYNGEPALEAGQALKVDMFEDIKKVDVVGISKGKGFEGAMKRWGFKGQPRTHGHVKHRSVGSIGSNTFPGRVLKGLKMAGHGGQRRVTAQNLEVVKVDKERNLLLVKGAVPGADGGYVVIKRSIKEGRVS
ncbi:MAG: 50S ribosomal protein L3 [Planctomycetota bacterium]|jgi:large subunit ribosomal protein L3|uniref:50S ribosomal protein L3 n=1 Tax=Candidatus Avalokitesvara rifleensis TaxID=3367620 RepID=UPI0027129430|nr:50S ribosomal protein L3 [Candidatus Brocadiales bacterium]